MKDKIIKILKICQIVVAIITFCLIFLAVNDKETGFILSNNLLFLPGTLYGIFLALFIADFILKEGAYKYLAGIYFGELLMCVVIFIQNDYILANTMIMLFGIANAILTTISYIRLINDKYTDLLPLGFYSKSHFYICYITILLLIGIGVSCYLIFEKNHIHLAYLLLLIPVAFVILLITLIKANPLVKALKTINNKLDYESFNKIIDKLVPNNLNQESRTYIEILRANYMLLDNYEEAIKYYENVGSLSNTIYLYYYAIVRCNFSSFTHNRKGFEDALYLLTNVTRKVPTQIEMSNAIWDVYNSNNEIQNVEKIFDVNTAIPLQRFSNKLSLMKYYSSRGNKEKALLYANELKDCPFRQYRKSALEIIEDKKDEKEIINN